MSVRYRIGELDPIEDQELIVKGDQDAAIRAMLADEAFVLLELPHDKSEYATKTAIYSFEGFGYVCAIRNQNAYTSYNCCDQYLCINNHEGNGKENLLYALKYTYEQLEKKQLKMEINLRFLSADEFMVYVKDKELVFGSYYTSQGGDTEGIYRKFFMDSFLKLRTYNNREHLIYDEFYDIRLFVTRIGDDPGLTSEGLIPEDVRNFDVELMLHDYLRERTVNYYSKSPLSYDLDFEAQSDMAQASYFLKCFYALYNYNHRLYHHLAGILCYRFSVFVLPGIVSRDKAESLSDDKRMYNFVNGSHYKIDSIHINTEICKSLSELKEWIDCDLDSMLED